MKTIKVIDLMQMYANKEVLPKKIIIHDNQLYDEDTIWEHKNNTFYCREHNGDTQFIFEYMVPEMLNDEVEIIEDTPIEDKKIDRVSLLDVNTDYKLKDILNEIIDHLNVEKKIFPQFPSKSDIMLLMKNKK